MERLLGGGIAGVLLAAVSVLSAPTAAATDFSLVVAMGGGSTNLPVAGVVPLTQIPNPPGPDLLVGSSGDVPDYTPPSAGTATVSLSSTGADLTTTNTGTVTVSAGQDIRWTLTPRQADGSTTLWGTFFVDCTATGDRTLGTVVVS